MTDLIWIASSSVLIIAVLIIRAVFGKRMSAGLRYALWGLVLLRLFIPGTVFQSPVSVQNAVMQSEPARVYETAKDYSAFKEADDGVIAIPRESGRTAVVMPKASQERAETLNRAVKARDVLTVVWCTGMGMMGAYLLYVNVRFYMKLRDRRKLLSADAPCKVYSVEGLESSCLFLNSIYVSAETADDADLLNCVLAHELSHRRHGDGIFTLLRGAALVLHWYNPFVWAAAYASRQDSELFADAGALKELGEERRETYGRTLIDLSLRPSVRASIACTATSMANNKHALTERVKNVASRRRMGVIIAAVVLILALAAAGCAFLGSAKAEEPAPYVPKTTDGPDARATDEPTDAPTAEPTEVPEKTGSELIDMAWAVAQQLGRVHQQSFNKERARIELSTSAVEVCFPSVTYPDEELWITLERDENGNYAAIPEDTCALRASEAFDSRLDSDLLAEKRAEFESARITVTADEIRASGCNAAVGSDEYKAAAAALYGEKLAGYYRESLSADTQFGCYETAFVGSEEGDYEDSYYVIIGFRVRDLLPFSILFDYEPSCDRGVRHQGFEGWLTGSTLVDVELAADGSFTCNAVLNGAG